MFRVRASVAVLFAFALRCPAAEDPFESILGATFRVAQGAASGTGFLVRHKEQLVLVTAAHVFQSMPGEDCVVVLREKRADGKWHRREFPLKLRQGNQTRWKKHPGLDIAALAVKLPDGVAATPFEFDQLADEAAFDERKVRVGAEVWIPGFPARLEANPSGWPVLRRGSIASHPLAPVKEVTTFIVDSATFGGDSGSPVVSMPAGDKAARPLVVGLLLGMHRQTDRSITPFEDRTVHTPLGLAIIVQAPFIRETVALATP